MAALTLEQHFLQSRFTFGWVRLGYCQIHNAGVCLFIRFANTITDSINTVIVAQYDRQVWHKHLRSSGLSPKFYSMQLCVPSFSHVYLNDRQSLLVIKSPQLQAKWNNVGHALVGSYCALWIELFSIHYLFDCTNDSIQFVCTFIVLLVHGNYTYRYIACVFIIY